MGVVLALLPMEVGAAIGITAAVLGAKALLRRPGFDQRSAQTTVPVGVDANRDTPPSGADGVVNAIKSLR
jgi:hypothetical protein